MSWRKYFKVADTNGTLSPISGKNQFGLPGYSKAGDGSQSPWAAQNEFAFRNYASRLPEVYSGHPNRIERYNQYENMDCDSEINACLDIIAEFSTQTNDDNQTPFDIQFTDKPTDHEVQRYQNNKTTDHYIKFELFDNEWGEIYLEPRPYVNTYFSLISETVFDMPYSFRTEKIWKPIVMAHPWITMANRGFYRDMHNLGFQTYSHVIDESFDMIDNNEDRLDRIVAVVNDLCSQDLASFLKECYNTSKYNQQHHREMAVKIRAEFPNRFFQFINE